ncbi:MAG: cyclic nucleotide-binding domain-containing protein [Candidatus Riflebacteria bacterium]|nr:cyclic nucleotide-binding domain-containing protein [Candidatus Riflebacteria bacterium]
MATFDDPDGQLVRLDAPTEADYEKEVTVEIDGRKVTVKQAEPLRGAEGNVILDLEGRTTPRHTTVFDAAVRAYEEYRRDCASEKGRPTAEPPGPSAAQAPGAPGWREFPIPVLCHQPHMKPVAVCRLCVVHVYGPAGGRWVPERRLTPACQRQVKDGMRIFTSKAPGPEGDPVRKAVRVLIEMLAHEHLKPAPAPAPAAELAPFNELKQVADRCLLDGSRFDFDVMEVPPPARPRSNLDASSPVFLVDHSACILCDRCARACDEIKAYHIIGRSGKGPTTRIGFDLDVPMAESGCVQCGECMVSCPTTAITFKPVATVKPATGARTVELLTAAELIVDPMLAGVPPKFLLWQEGLVVRRRLKAGEILCRQGEPGNSAFLIKSGRLGMIAWPEDALASGVGGLRRWFKKPPEPLGRFQVGPADVIVGEMACVSGNPRSGDLVAVEDGEVWELRRNVLDRILRSPAQRARFEGIYRKRALDAVLQSAEVFQGLPPDEFGRCVEFLRPRLSFVRVSPGQVFFKQGDPADSMCLVRLGHVRVAISQFGREVTVLFSGPGTVIGEMGLMAIPAAEALKSVDEIDRVLSNALLGSGAADLSSAIPTGRRSATCSALDHLEMARIGRADFLEMLRAFGSVRRRLIQLSVDRLRGDLQFASEASLGEARREYVAQGLYQGQSLLVLDLTRCTRCDLCTRACVDQHGSETHGVPLTRLVREGLRFGDYLVATACRSCKDAYCMIGCPVDAIHRGRHKQIVIENHCIGCGLCARNCPYGNIFMVPNELQPRDVPDPDRPGRTLRVAQPKAATCDLCDAAGRIDRPVPRCVYVCPHDAAFRMTGEQLLEKVTGMAAQKVKG